MNEAKVCVVTGSSSGIGAATVRLYASKGGASSSTSRVSRTR